MTEDKTLRLNLKAEWYDMIESGVKTEEYREIKDYWIKRLMKDFPVSWIMTMQLCMQINKFNAYYGKELHPVYKTVTFVYGYTKRTMEFELEKVTVGKGNKEWGAPDEDVFIIKLGKRIN